MQPDPETGRLALIEDGDGDATGAVRVTNKTDEELVIALEVLAARVGPDGTPILGGSAAIADRVRLAKDTVTLGPGAAEVVEVTLESGDSPSDATSAAVVASPAFASDDAPAVLARVGLVLTVRPGDPMAATAVGESGIPVWLTWVALALAVTVLGSVVRTFVRRGRRQAPKRPSPASSDHVCHA